MANIEIANAQYNDVPSIEVPKQGGGVASFMDTDDGDVSADDVNVGKICYSQGQRIVGTRSGGGGGVTVTNLFQSESGLGSGTINLTDDWNNYDFISGFVWTGNTNDSINEIFYSKAFLENAKANGLKFAFIRYSTQYVMCNCSSYSAFTITNSQSYCKVFRIDGYKF